MVILFLPQRTMLHDITVYVHLMNHILCYCTAFTQERRICLMLVLLFTSVFGFLSQEKLNEWRLFSKSVYLLSLVYSMLCYTINHVVSVKF